jgi:glycosyltransferase involved in cell wall biosynthesis
LDPQTIEAADSLVPGKWSALPHPIEFDESIPYASDKTKRAVLLEATKSPQLVLLAASQNWSQYHNKGTRMAAESFVELRKRGEEVGLVCVKWGPDVDKSMILFERAGVAKYVTWVDPMPRHQLQKLMACVDLAWDQFGLEAFGALALRTLEQGCPLVSRGLSDQGINLIGSQVPWEISNNQNELVDRTSSILNTIRQEGREIVHSKTAAKYKAWLQQFHSPQITTLLQLQRYTQILNDSQKLSLARPDEWRRLARALWREQHTFGNNNS